MSSGCVLRKVSQLFSFSCEKECDSLGTRRALLEDFVSKVYDTEAVYVDYYGNKSKENYITLFKLSQKQEDNTMNIIHGSGALLKGDEVIKLSLTGNYLPKINGYSMKLRGENIEKEFNLSCAGNDKINFFIRKTVSEDSTVRNSQGIATLYGGGVINPLEPGGGGGGIVKCGTDQLCRCIKNARFTQDQSDDACHSMYNGSSELGPCIDNTYSVMNAAFKKCDSEYEA